MAKKHALLIANTEYRDGRLAPLPHPGLAYAELAEALKDPARGAFSQVETLVNANLSHVLGAVDRFFSRKPADAVLLVYVGGHGFVDAQGELFLALKESDRFRLKSTALMAAVLGMNMDQCPSPHKLLILDCRYHSPYQDSRGNDQTVRIDPAKVFGGRGLPKLILAAGDGQGKSPAASGRDSGPRPAGSAIPSTQKIQAVGRDFTRTLAECLRGPSDRSALTVEDWWNEVAAVLKASRCEPPSRHAVGEPPVTVLRGASFPRQEMALTGSGDTSVSLPGFPMDPESDWSRLSGIFPLEMIAPDLVPPPAEEAAESVAEDFTGGAAEGELGDGSAEGGADLGGSDEGGKELPQATMARMEMRRMEIPRGDETIIADASYLQGGDEGRPSSVQDEAARVSADDFASMRARLLAQEEAERQARLKQESEEAAQREKLERWKARWESRRKGEPENKADEPSREAAPPAGAPAEFPSAAEDGNREKPGPSRTPYQARAAAMQKTLFVPPPDSEDEGAVPPPQALSHQPAVTPPAPPAMAVPDGLATAIVPRDQFLNTGTHKTATPLAPGATILVSRDEFLGRAEPSALEANAEEPPDEPQPPEPPRQEAPGGGFRRKAALWALAGLLPVGLGLFVVFGAKSGLFPFPGLGEEPPAVRKEGSRIPAAAPASTPRPKPTLPPAAGAGTSKPTSAEAAAAPTKPAAAEPSAPSQSAVPAVRASSPAPAKAPAPAPAAPAKKPTPAPSPDPARQAGLRARKAYQDSIQSVYYRLRQDSLRAARAARDSVLTARAQAKQDSIQAVRLRLDLERNLKAEIAAAKAAVAKARQDSIRAVKDSIQAEAILNRAVEAARKADIENMRGLYNRFAMGYPGLKGEVIIYLQVAPDGEIEKGVIAHSTTGLAMFDRMVLGNVLEWKLKPFKGGKAKSIDVAIQFPVE